MLLRKPVEEVFEAFVVPAITTQFRFSKSSGRLEAGKQVRWEREMCGVPDDIRVKAFETNKRIQIEWPDGTEVEWTFEPRTDNHTFVTR